MTIDVERFERTGRGRARRRRCRRWPGTALAAYGGELLPEDRYADWAEARREQLRRTHLDLLRLAGRWERVIEIDDTDEPAHLALMRRYADSGDRHAALRQFERMDRALRRELGVAPGDPAVQLRDRLLAEQGARTGRPGPDDRPRRGAGQGAEAVAGHRVRPQPDADHHRPGRGGQVDDAGRDRRAGGRVGLRRRAGHVGRGRGGVAVRAGRGGARRPVPATPRPARRAARRAPPGDRPGAGRGRAVLDRGQLAPAAVRRGHRAGPAGRRLDRPAAHRRRRARGRRRQPPAAALHRALDPRPAGVPGAGAPPGRRGPARWPTPGAACWSGTARRRSSWARSARPTSRRWSGASSRSPRPSCWSGSPRSVEASRSRSTSWPAGPRASRAGSRSWTSR